MKSRIYLITMMSIINMLSCICAANAQDKVYASILNSSEVRSITANSSTGATTGNFGSSFSIEQSAAIGYAKYSNVGYIISLQYTSDDHVDIYAKKADGTGSNVKIINNADIANGDVDLDYVRLGIDANNVGWIVSKSSGSNNIYVGSFTWNGNLNNPITVVTKRGKLNTNDNTNSIFINGDLAIASNTMFVLANNGSGSTKIYTVALSNLLSANSGSTNIITSKWDLRTSTGSQFSGTVNGFAFASSGSAYLSTSTGLYFIDQATTNTGTVKCSLIKSQTDITDLATSYVPTTTSLPVTIKSIKVTLSHSKNIK
jgi:hypothetical protein